MDNTFATAVLQRPLEIGADLAHDFHDEILRVGTATYSGRLPGVQEARTASCKTVPYAYRGDGGLGFAV